MPNCHNCHAPVAEGSGFCSSCGAKQNSDLRICPGCNAPVEKGAAFCSVCGAKQESDLNVCPGCSTPITKEDIFCPNCGTKNGHTAPIVKENTASIPTVSSAIQKSPGKLHCPHCGSHNITVTTESSVNGALTAHGGAGSSTVVSNTHRNFWICSDCGTKFRNIQSLEEEILASKNSPIVAGIIGGISAIIAIWLAIMASTSFLGVMFIPYIAGAGIAAIVSAVVGYISVKKTKKMKKELEYLKDKCFN